MGQPLERHYGRLSVYLTARAVLDETRVTLPFAALEAILGRPLPASAWHPRGHRQWWRGHGAGSPHGWTVAAVDLTAATVTFMRTSADH